MSAALQMQQHNAYEPDAPWGRTEQSALRWAYSMLAREQSIKSILGDLRQSHGVHISRELSRLEMHGQAASIRGVVERMKNPYARAYLIAHYMPAPQLIRQPGINNPELIDAYKDQRIEVYAELRQWLIAKQGTGVHNTRIYGAIIEGYFLGNFKWARDLKRLMDILGIAKSTACEKRQQCEKQLMELGTQAHALAHNALYEAGILA